MSLSQKSSLTATRMQPKIQGKYSFRNVQGSTCAPGSQGTTPLRPMIATPRLPLSNNLNARKSPCISNEILFPKHVSIIFSEYGNLKFLKPMKVSRLQFLVNIDLRNGKRDLWLADIYNSYRVPKL
ncbi:uncharacterized protein LOC112684449 [Sipha flava]|uniref:Uncharacterized protein LOC112684449 n=1 Tax=Sipha flava TaxID=143950 RepID=A0A8B8FN41_9HEMI|nr:uncharacterized protein LOC112684449 [Sipha flava]